MSNANRFYELSLEAEHDLEAIFSYTERHFGRRQAVFYVSQIDHSFVQLVSNPGMGRMREEIRTGLRSFAHGNHIIFYRILTNHIRIVRILHARRDIQQNLDI